jgi:hypothetical protein
VKHKGKLWNVFFILYSKLPDIVRFTVWASWDSHFDQSKTVVLIPINLHPRRNLNKDSHDGINLRVFLARNIFQFDVESQRLH